MALFEFEDGHLVPAQFGYPVAQDLGPELVDAICQQVLQIVSRPLFPVTWRDMTGQGDEETPRLTALDVSGQIVSVEILKELDSETLITSLSRLAEVASISWSDLASEYPSGPEGFRAGWAQFRDSMPRAVGPGPRLIIVAGEIDPSVRPALSILATSGVEVHLMNLRQMSNGRLFLDVNAVGPRLYGHAPQLLASASVAAPEIVAPAQESIEEVDADASVESDSETPTTRPTPKVAPHLREVFTYPIDEEPPAPWRPASEEDEQDEAEADAQDEHEATEQDAGDERIETDEHVDGDAVAEDGDEYAHESVEADRAEDAEADAQDADERDADSHAEHVPESDEHESNDAAATQHGETEETGELPDHEEPRAEENAESDEDMAAGEQADERADEQAGEHADDQAAEHVGDQPADHAETETEPDEEGDDVPEHADEQVSTEDDAPRWEPPAHMSRRATRRAREESSELNDGGATDAATASFVDRADESPEVVQARAEGLPVLGRDESGLRTLAQILGEDTPLIARGELGLPGDLVLAASGAVSGAGLTYPSLDTLLTARGLGHIDVWGQVRIGDRLGPTLAEALDEVNREIVREYAQAPRGHRSAKH
ncbi:hypothetical protein O3684_04705 [Pauljensenia sp. 20925_1_27]